MATPDILKNFQQDVGTPQPPPTIPPMSLDAAFSVIRDQVADGYKFSNRQKDLCVEVTLPGALPDKSEQDWFREVAEQNNVPLWVALFAQWRRAAEAGGVARLILDPDWPTVS